MEDGPVVAECPNVVNPVVGQSDLNVHNRITQRSIPKGHEATDWIRCLIGIRFGQAVRYGVLVYTLCITLSCLIVFLIKFVVRSYLTLTLWMQPFHRLHPNRGKNILVDLDTFRSGRVYFARIYYKIGGESAYVLRVILWVDWDGMIDLSIR